MQDLIAKLKKSHKKLLNTSIYEIAEIIDNLGKYFLKEDVKKELLAVLPEITGFSYEMCESGIVALSNIFSKQSVLHRIEGELGNCDYSDDFLMEKNYLFKKRATPLGIVFHIAPSNVFLGIADSILMAMITKNSSIVKLSGKDTFFPEYLKNALGKIDKKSILYDNLELVYFSHEDERLINICNQTDAILFWGGLEAMDFYRKNAGSFTKLILNGPRYSLAFIEEKSMCQKDYHNLAKDCIFWEQAACSSPQAICVLGDVEKVADNLKQEIKELLKLYPAGKLDIDEKIEILKEREEGRIKAIENNEEPLFSPSNTDFTLIKLYNEDLRISPSHRTLFLKSVKNINEFIKLTGIYKNYLQTIGIKLSIQNEQKFYEKFKTTGFYRAVPLGSMTSGVEGAPHDGKYLLQELINWQVIEVNNLKRLENILYFAKNKSAYYKKIIPDSLNLKEIPLLTRELLLENSPPKSNKILTGKVENGFYFCSGGSTGNPKYSFYSNEDFDESCKVLSNIFLSAGINKEDIIANIFIAGNLWTSFLVVNEAIKSIGCINLPVSGSSRVEDMASYVNKFKATAIIGLPSLIMSLCEYIYKNKIKHNVKKILYGGEHFSKEAIRFLTEDFGADFVKSAGYAMVDAGPVGIQCEYLDGGFHHPCDEYNFIEIIDENGNEVSEGEKGEIIVTNISRKLMPIIRFKTGDLGRWIKTDKVCKCGRKRVFELLGRCDDVLIIAGMILLFDDVSKALGKVKQLSKIFQLVAEDDGIKEKLTIRVETDKKVDELKTFEEIKESLKNEADNIYFSMKQGLLNLNVEFLKTGEIERNPRTGKIRQLIDLRRN